MGIFRGGLGLDPDMVDWAITGLRSLRPDKEIAFDKAIFIGKLGKNGRPKKGEENSDSVRVSGFGNSSAYVISRLQRDNQPDLAEKVIAGELSANAAAIEAGFRKPTLTVPADPDAAVAALIRKFGRAAVLAAIQRVPP